MNKSIEDRLLDALIELGRIWDALREQHLDKPDDAILRDMELVEQARQKLREARAEK